MSQVVVVDDDIALARALAINLRAHGYEVQLAHDGGTALEKIARIQPAVIVLDLGLPDLDGIEVLTRIRGWSIVPVIVLSARSTSAEKAAALDAGADDYVTKPFRMQELLACVRAAARRATIAEGADTGIVTTADFTVDIGGHQVIRNGEPVRLTPTEWLLLDLLVRHTGTLVPKLQMLTAVRGTADTHETQYLKVYLARLRRKLEPDPTHPRHFITESGLGYRFEE